MTARGSGVLRAAVVAGTLSGLPSTVHALATGRPVAASVRAAGTLLGRPTIPRGAVAHIAITALWSAIVVPRLPRLPQRRRLAAGAAAGVAIHVLDLELLGRCVPAVRALPRLAQLADHVAFGLLLAVSGHPSSS